MSVPLPGDVDVVDVETCGLEVHTTRLREIAVVSVRDGRLDNAWAARFAFGDASLLPVADVVAERLSRVPIVGHNVAFDIRCVASSLGRCGVMWRPRNAFCTLRLARTRRPCLEHYGLETVARDLGIGETPTHEALPDAIVTAMVYLKFRGAEDDRWSATAIARA